ncbi:MAG: hypothetical protein E6J90_43165 [Deltaproteobacteria bacterium]|nr:MAG: hypothetical protein E6J90_43165 [Deltaproteobacteria bacterium]
MALPPITPRDQLQRLVDLSRKTWRHWWLIAVFAVVGGGLSLAFALTRPRNFQTWATLFYQERIQSQLLSPGREEVAQRNIGDRYRELLLTRNSLDQIVVDPALDPYPQERDPDLKIDKLRQAVRLEAHGANVFRIMFTDSDPERAKRVVDKLAKMLQDKDEALRNEQAAATVAFAIDQQEAARAELKKRENAYTEFLAKHPEFVQDANNSQNEGASIRAIRTNKPTGGNARLVALERQRQRLQASLDAPPGVPVPQAPAPRTPERVAAEAAVQEAQRELNTAKRELEEVLTRLTPIHPTAVKAKERVDAATQRLRQAAAAVPPDVEPVVIAATPENRAKLQKDLQQIEAQIAAEQSKSGKTDSPPDAATSWVVRLEGEHNELRRAVTEQRERVQSLADSVFRAQMDANQKLAEQGGRLAIVDPAFKPARPTGTGKSVFLLAGMILFLTLGLSFAVGLAVIDDRLYRRADLDQLGISVLAVIPPPVARARKVKRRPKTMTQGGAA